MNIVLQARLDALDAYAAWAPDCVWSDIDWRWWNLSVVMRVNR